MLALLLHVACHSVGDLVHDGEDLREVTLLKGLRRLKHRVFAVVHVEYDGVRQVLHILHLVCLLDNLSNCWA